MVDGGHPRRGGWGSPVAKGVLRGAAAPAADEVRLCVVSFRADDLGILTAATDRAYIFLAGGVLIWAGLAGVGRAFKRVLPADLPGAPDQDGAEKQDGRPGLG
jgi:hypothetical protein